MNLMGVDLGIHKIAMFGWDGDVPYAHAWATDPGLSRSAQLHSLAGMVHDMADFHSADYVWIEDTIIGNNRKYSIQLSETKGAVMSALGLHYDVHLVDNKTWKKAVVGGGNANKENVRYYIHVTHGAYAPLCGDDQDLYDACCIALYGRQLIERASDLRLATGRVADSDEPGGP